MGKIKYNDYPFEEIAEDAGKILAQDKNASVYQKFSCENCGSRQTIDEPNRFYTLGKCEECSHVTDLRRRGCNFMVMTTFGGETKR